MFVDALGNAHSPFMGDARIVSLVPSITELLFSLDLGDQVVGRTSFCVHPATVKYITRVGGTKTPNINKIKEVVTLLGRNGMGKSTTVNSIMGVVPSQVGEISFLNHRIEQFPSYRRAQLGLSVVPEGRQIFPNLTVFENLVATAKKKQMIAR